MFGFHAIYMAVLLLILAVPVAIVILVVILATRERGPARAPLLSQDGRYWWDGTQWQPVPNTLEPPSPPASASGS